MFRWCFQCALLRSSWFVFFCSDDKIGVFCVWMFMFCFYCWCLNTGHNVKGRVQRKLESFLLLRPLKFLWRNATAHSLLRLKLSCVHTHETSSTIVVEWHFIFFCLIADRWVFRYFQESWLHLYFICGVVQTTYDWFNVYFLISPYLTDVLWSRN